MRWHHVVEVLATAEAFCVKHGYRKLVLSTSELQQAAAQLYQSSGYSMVREEKAAAPSHKPGSVTTTPSSTRWH